MRSVIASVLLLSLGALPLSAQLTPAQRQERAVQEFSQNYARLRAARMEERALNGDASLYGGPVSFRERFGWGWGSEGMFPVAGRYRASPNTHWVALTRRGVPPARLADPATQQLTGLAQQQGRLTLASPAGAPGTPLLIRVAITDAQGATSWSSATEVTGDETGRYTLFTPALARGAYSMKVEVFENGIAAEPYSTSSDPLTVE